MGWWGKQSLRPGEIDEIKGKIVKIRDSAKGFLFFLI
jgi:hypothetical protein